MLLDIEATRCLSSLISVSRWDPLADVVVVSLVDKGRIGTGAVLTWPPAAVGIEGAAFEGDDDDDDDDVEEDEAEGILLISVNRSSLPLRKESCRNLQNLDVSASSSLSMRREFENLTLRKP
jgi:hypothetical protein